MRRIITRGLGEAGIPSGFAWPTFGEYAQYTSQALARVKDTGFSLLVAPDSSIPTSDVGKLILTATAGGHKEAITTIVETIVNKSIDVIGVQGVSPSTVNNLVYGLQDALNGNIEGAVIGAIRATAGIAETLSAIPVIGMIAEWVCTTISAMYDSAGYHEEQFAASAAQCQAVLQEQCSKRIEADAPFGTGSEGVTPSDMFRQNLYAYRGKATYPINIGSMYIGLCGGEAQGVGIDRARYNEMMGWVRAKHGASIGINPEIQKTMWKLIKGIMFSAERTDIRVDITPIGDKGRSLFPILQDIVRNEYLRFKTTGKGGWNDDVALAISDYTVGWVQAQGKSTGGVGVAVTFCDCASPVRRVDLTRALVESVFKWQAHLQEKFLSNGRFIYGATPSIKKVKGVIMFSNKQSEKMVRAGALKPSLTAPQKATVAAGAVGGSYIAWEIIRRLVTRGI
jgi:hypothetical protein